MREILFRGRCPDDGAWKFGAYGNHTSLDAMIIDRPYLTADNDLAALGFWTVDPNTVGQYTGLTDRNGVKVFEGDILIFIEPDAQELDDNERFVVRWYEDASGFLLEIFYEGKSNNWDEIDKTHLSNFEVIGNIYDNPELLGGVTL